MIVRIGISSYSIYVIVALPVGYIACSEDQVYYMYILANYIAIQIIIMI